jgi:Transposase DDE domain
MYLRTVTRKNKNGSSVGYLQLAHNEWDPAAQVSRRTVLYNFGREDQVDREAIARLIASLSQVLTPGQAMAATTPPELTFTESRPLGGTHALDGLWHRLGIDALIRGLVKDPRSREKTERTLFALVANRALKPSSKLAASQWVGEDVAIAGLPAVDDDFCYRAMDRLLTMETKLAEQVYWAVADLLNLEVDLLFFDTTSTYFETGQADEPLARNEYGRCLPEPAPQDSEASTDAEDPVHLRGFRAFGKSKDHRDDLPQVIIGMAVTRTGIPIRVWSWPGATSDSALIRQVKDELKEWTLGRVVWVADRGFTSAANRRYLQRAGGHYILGEKLRTESPEVEAALGRQGRYKTLADNMRIKEVKVADADDRFVICHNPDQAKRDAATREQLIAQLADVIDRSDKLSRTKRAELRGKLSTKPGLNRYLRVTPGGLLRIDRTVAKAEENLDGKYLLRSSDPKLSAEDIALGYKQLLEVERGWRDMKSIIDLRPVYHRLEDRIRAHVLLCWLALLLIRIIETTCNDTWSNLRLQLERLHVGTFTGPAGVFRQCTEVTKAQQAILTALQVPQPPRILEVAPPA